MWDLNWLLQRLTWADILDISLVAVLFFWLFYTIRGTRALPLVRGLTVLLISLALLSRVVELRAFSWLIQQLLPAFLVALPVLFQPELRRAFEQLGRGRLTRLSQDENECIARAVDAVVEASAYMAARHIGALIVFERHTGLKEYTETGIPLNAQVTPELLTTLFDHHTILHDGAVIIHKGRLVAAACVLPLTAAFLADRELGLRHRAALGVTEDTDAVTVVVSEERGAISLAHNGRIIRDVDAPRLASILHAFLLPKPRASGFRLFRQRLPQEERENT
ncbi:MAG TPA: diadenylate cyclase CdaA [Anaerolineae bacterium]|nr:diadenylate cyclase CdaA [Anaerolineae bacterium]